MPNYALTPNIPLRVNTPSYFMKKGHLGTPGMVPRDGSNYTTSTTDTPLFGHFPGRFEKRNSICDVSDYEK
jgi:hypothetical protein